MKRVNWVLLRGLTRETAHWGAFVSEMTARFPMDKLYPIDLPGSGAYCFRPTPLTIEEITAQVRGQLIEQGVCIDLSTTPTVVIGLSMGGMIAVHWATQYPNELAGIVLINTSLRSLSPFWRRLRPSVVPSLFATLCVWDRPIRERLILNLTSAKIARYDELSAVEIEKHWAEIQRHKPVSRTTAIRQLIAAARYCGKPQLFNTLPLVLCGDNDRIVNPDCSKALAHFLNCRLRVHSSAGHDLPLDQPHWCLDEIADWRHKL